MRTSLPPATLGQSQHCALTLPKWDLQAGWRVKEERRGEERKDWMEGKSKGRREKRGEGGEKGEKKERWVSKERGRREGGEREWRGSVQAGKGQDTKHNSSEVRSLQIFTL